MTKQREEIFSEFISSTGHFTVEDLYNKVSRVNAKIGNNTARYEHNHFEHYHLSCIKCNKLIEVKSYRMLKLIKELAMDENFKFLSSSVVISGICEECMEKVFSKNLPVL